MPKYIAEGKFPESFTVNERNFKFIVISPQFSIWPHPQHIQEVLDYITPLYKIDRSRIYITGISMGGGATWDYAQSNVDVARSIAAIVPIAGQSDPKDGTPGVMADGNLAVWATHNQGDPNVPVERTNEFIEAILNKNPTVIPKKTIFNVTAHDAWTTTYDPAFEEEGLNIYEWMLQHVRGSDAALAVTYSSFNAIILPTGDNLISWSTTFEANSQTFTLEHSSDGNIFLPLTIIPSANKSTGTSYQYLHQKPPGGKNYYRLVETDLDGTQTVSKIITTVVSTAAMSQILLYQSSANNIRLEINDRTKGKLNLTLFTPEGKLIKKFTRQKNGDKFVTDFESINLQSGIYIVTIQTKDYLYARALRIMSN